MAIKTGKVTIAAPVLSLSAEVAVAPWQPSVERVASLLRARTKTSNGAEAGTFNDDTRPTAQDVKVLIAQAVNYVASRVGTTGSLCNGTLSTRAGDMSTLYTAMLIELSYFPEQIERRQSPYDAYKALWDEGMDSLVEAVAETCGEGGDGDVVGGSDPGPSYSFAKSTRDLGMEVVW